MGSIRELDSQKNVHLLFTSSNLVELYVYDTLKTQYNAGGESIFTIDSKGSFNEMMEVLNAQPFMADKWLFVITYNKVKALLKDRSDILNVGTAVFLIKVANYKEFKEVKDLASNCNDMYLANIRFYDVVHLFSDYEMSNAVIEFIARSYYSDPEQVFKILEEVKNGAKFKTRKDVTELCGVSSSSIDYFVLKLLKEFPKTERGAKMVYKKRLNTAKELADTYTISTFRNFLTACVKDMLDIKQLYLMGIIYDKVVDLPEPYDVKRLKKYNRVLEKIKEIPYERIINLYCNLKKCGRWYSDLDMCNFFYQYYGGV